MSVERQRHGGIFRRRHAASRASGIPICQTPPFVTRPETSTSLSQVGLITPGVSIALKKAICADPAQLLKTWTLKKLIKIPLRAITNSTRKKFVQQVRQSSAKKGPEADLPYKKDKKPPSILNANFDRSLAMLSASTNRWLCFCVR